MVNSNFYAIMIKSFQKEVAMNILVIDAQGGGIGKQVVAAVKNNFLSWSLQLLAQIALQHLQC